MSGRMSQARESIRVLQFAEANTMCYLIVGLGIDCSPWVKTNIITHDDMLDRNWAHWTTFCQVRSIQNQPEL